MTVKTIYARGPQGAGGFGGITIGDGVTTEGTYNGQTQAPFVSAVAAAIASGFPIVVLPGSYTFTEPVEIAGPIDMRGFGEVLITVNHTESVGVFDVTANSGVLIDGIKIISSTFVASQEHIKIRPLSGTTSLGHKIRNNTITFNHFVASGFSAGTGNEMRGISLTRGMGCDIANNWIYPSLGSTGIYGTLGSRNHYHNNHVTNLVNANLPNTSDASRRAAYRGIHLKDEGSLFLYSNDVANLGLIAAGTDYQITNAIYIEFSDVSPLVDELGHIKVYDNTVEDCLSSTDSVCVVRGARWGQLDNNFNCFNGIADTHGTGHWKIEGANGATGFPSRNITFRNHVHNPGGLSTRQCSGLYLRNCDGIRVIASDFNELYCEQAIEVDCSTGVTQSSLTLTFAAADNSITRSTGSWDASIVAGSRIRVTGASTNGSDFMVTVASVSSSTKLIAYGQTLVNESSVAGCAVQTVSVSNLTVAATNFTWPSDTPSAKRVPVLRTGTSGAFHNFNYDAASCTRENSTAAYDGTAASGSTTSVFG